MKKKNLNRKNVQRAIFIALFFKILEYCRTSSVFSVLSLSKSRLNNWNPFFIPNISIKLQPINFFYHNTDSFLCLVYHKLVLLLGVIRVSICLPYLCAFYPPWSLPRPGILPEFQFRFVTLTLPDILPAH